MMTASGSASPDHTEEDGNKIQSAEVVGVHNAPTSLPGSETPSYPHRLAVRSAESITSSATGQTQSVQIVTAISTVKATASAAAQDGSMPVDTKIALGVGIPVGVILIIVLVVGGFILGRRPAKREQKSTNTWWRRLSKSTGEDKQDTENPDRLCLSASQDKYELPGDRPPGELATTYNIQELPEERRPVELPQTSPVEVPRRSPVELE